jgi:HAD superfamily hydrolase (TIGR01509 family)
MIQAVIFDVDGTLVDSVDLQARAWQEAFHHFGTDVPFDEVRQQIGKGGDHLMPAFLSRKQVEVHGKEIEDYRKELFGRKYMPEVEPLPRVRELFERLRADGRRIVLASSAKADDLEKYKRIAGIEDLLDTETTADDHPESNPHPDIFEAALQRLPGVPPDEVIAIGDTPYDSETAGKAGLKTIGVLSGGFPIEQLREAGCVEIYCDVADLLEHYDKSVLGGD